MPPDQSELVAEIFQSVFELRYKLRKMFQLKIKEAGIDTSYEFLEILKIVSLHKKINQQQLADLLFKDKSSITYLIDNMVNAGLVSRKADEDDRRNKRLILSDMASELLKQLEPIAHSCYTAIGEDITGGSIRTGLRTLHKMNDSLTRLMI